MVGSDSQITVDISKTLEKKIASIACYATQFPPVKAHIYDRIRGLAIAAGAAAGCAAGEVFACTRPLATLDLFEAVGLRR